MLTLSNELQPQMSRSNHHRRSSSGSHSAARNQYPLDNNSIDHLFLLPERALSMSASRLQKDLAGLDFDVRLLHEAPMGNVWLSGSRPSSVTKEERENRARTVRERQHEERQRKLDEIKAQAFAAQRFKEQKETERRHRMDELRNKEDSRRAQVEERKRAINEAERDRLESILKRNQEREARIDAKKRNERSSMVFAFGSSTPRMLDDIGPYCGPRRATSTQNIMSASVMSTSVAAGVPSYGTASASTGGPAPSPEAGGAGLTRRQSERDLDATGTGQQPQVTTPAGCVSGYVGRRRTDLVPTIPLKDTSSLNNSINGTKSRSSPGRAYSMSRLDQLATPRKRHVPSQDSLVALAPLFRSDRTATRGGADMSRSMNHLANSKGGAAQGPARPLRKADSRSMHHLSSVAPLPPPRMTRAAHLRNQMQLKSSVSSLAIAPNEAPSRPGSALSQQSMTSVVSSTTGPSSTVHMRNRPLTTPVRKPRPISIAVTGVTAAAALADKTSANGNIFGTKPPLPKSRRHTAVLNRSQDRIKKTTKATGQQQAVISPIELPKQPEMQEIVSLDIKPEQPQQQQQLEVPRLVPNEENIPVIETRQVAENSDLISIVDGNATSTDHVVMQMSTELAACVLEDVDLLGLNEDPNVDMTASMLSKVRINTEEEAKAALAEKRRIAREEAEKQAEMERQQREEEIRAEQERQQREEEQQRLLIEEMKAAEQKRLEEAIKQKQFEEEEERRRVAEENRQKVLKEEAERRAKEEAEKQKFELEERMRNEEKEREQRRKRVEAIMLRTRGKNTTNTSPPQSEEKSDKLNGSNAEVAENGHKNGKNIETVDNIIPVDTLKNANIIESLSTDDALNSNNAWQINTPTDLLM